MAAPFLDSYCPPLEVSDRRRYVSRSDGRSCRPFRLSHPPSGLVSLYNDSHAAVYSWTSTITRYALSGRKDSRPPTQGNGDSDGTLETSNVDRLSASDFSCGGKAVLSLAKDSGIMV